MIIRKWCEACGCVTPQTKDGGCRYCVEKDADQAVIRAAEAWRENNKGFTRIALTLAVDALRKARSE